MTLVRITSMERTRGSVTMPSFWPVADEYTVPSDVNMDPSQYRHNSIS
jgi:hypothetical protein